MEPESYDRQTQHNCSTFPYIPLVFCLDSLLGKLTFFISCCCIPSFYNNNQRFMWAITFLWLCSFLGCRLVVEPSSNRFCFPVIKNCRRERRLYWFNVLFFVFSNPIYRNSCSDNETSGYYTKDRSYKANWHSNKVALALRGCTLS